MTKILLTRHGHVEGIHPERFRGHAELALTPQGVAEAKAVAARIAATWKPVTVYTQRAPALRRDGDHDRQGLRLHGDTAQGADGYRLRRLADAHA
jgi:hypothetical protein